MSSFEKRSVFIKPSIAVPESIGFNRKNPLLRTTVENPSSITKIEKDLYKDVTVTHQYSDERYCDTKSFKELDFERLRRNLKEQECYLKTVINVYQKSKSMSRDVSAQEVIDKQSRKLISAKTEELSEPMPRFKKIQNDEERRDKFDIKNINNRRFSVPVDSAIQPISKKRLYKQVTDLNEIDLVDQKGNPFDISNSNIFVNEFRDLLPVTDLSKIKCSKDICSKLVNKLKQ